MNVISYGKTAATEIGLFVSAYRIAMSHQGVVIDGNSPDGRHTGTCDRCGTAIMNVYVFSNDNRSTFMHVGIDCAQKMGISLMELKSARSFWRRQAIEAENAVRRASLEDRRRKEEEARKARLAAAEELVNEINDLRMDARATTWERDRLNTMIAYTAEHGDSWFHSPEGESDTHELKTFFAIRERLHLCGTSTHQESAKRVRMRLNAYRKPVSFDGMYGLTFVNFLTDGVNAYVYKGGKRIDYGDIVEATWTLENADVRDGLTSTVLKRPAKGVVTTEDGTELNL